jgi:hypothetical protein
VSKDFKRQEAIMSVSFVFSDEFLMENFVFN